jgi:hypothetical protein
MNASVTRPIGRQRAKEDTVAVFRRHCERSEAIQLRRRTVVWIASLRSQ